MGLSVDFKGTKLTGVPARELIFRRILGQPAEVYVTVPIIDIDNKFDLDTEIKEVSVSVEGNQIFPRLLVDEIRGTPFFPKEYADSLTRAWYIKASLKDIFKDYKLGPDLHNKVLATSDMLAAFKKLNSPKFFTIGDNLQSKLKSIKPSVGDKLNIVQFKQNNWKMFEHLVGLYNQRMPPQESICFTETDNGIDSFSNTNEYCDLNWTQAEKNNGLLPVLENSVFGGKSIRPDLYFHEYYKHPLHGHPKYARCHSYLVNVNEHFDIASKGDVVKVFKAPCPAFFQNKFVCELRHVIKFQDATFTEWTCSIVTLQNNEQVLDAATPAFKEWEGKGKVTSRDKNGPWLKVELNGFESPDNVADVYVTTPYSGDGQSNKIGFHITPENDSPVLVRSSQDCIEPIYLKANLSSQPADNKPHWMFPSLDMDMKGLMNVKSEKKISLESAESLNLKSEEKVSLKGPGVKVDLHNGQLNVDEGE